MSVTQDVLNCDPSELGSLLNFDRGETDDKKRLEAAAAGFLGRFRDVKREGQPQAENALQKLSQGAESAQLGHLVINHAQTCAADDSTVFVWDAVNKKFDIDIPDEDMADVNNELSELGRRSEAARKDEMQNKGRQQREAKATDFYEQAYSHATDAVNKLKKDPSDLDAGTEISLINAKIQTWNSANGMALQAGVIDIGELRKLYKEITARYAAYEQSPSHDKKTMVLEAVDVLELKIDSLGYPAAWSLSDHVHDQFGDKEVPLLGETWRVLYWTKYGDKYTRAVLSRHNPRPSATVPRLYVAVMSGRLGRPLQQVLTNDKTRELHERKKELPLDATVRGIVPVFAIKKNEGRVWAHCVLINGDGQDLLVSMASFLTDYGLTARSLIAKYRMELTMSTDKWSHFKLTDPDHKWPDSEVMPQENVPYRNVQHARVQSPSAGPATSQSVSTGSGSTQNNGSGLHPNLDTNSVSIQPSGILNALNTNVPNSNVVNPYMAQVLSQLAALNLNGMNQNGMNQNGMNPNVMYPNGMNPNVMYPNGMNPNVMYPNGMNLNGMNQNGMTYNGMNLNGMNFNGTNPRSMRPNGMNLNGMNLNGMIGTV